MEGASGGPEGDDRRHFLKIMGASMAMAGIGLTGCRRWPKEHIVPFAHRPQGTMPGVPESFATCRNFLGMVQGTLVTSHDGRPTKVEGNPLHPDSLGATDLFAQASVLELYDQDRLTSVIDQRSETPTDVSAEMFDTWLQQTLPPLKRRQGEGLWILSEPSESPSVAAQRQRLAQRLPGAMWVTWSPCADHAQTAALQSAFRGRYSPKHNLADADLIVSFEADFMGPGQEMIPMSRGWARGRSGENGTMNRMLVAESSLSLTGTRADNRYPMKSTDVTALAVAVARELLGEDAVEGSLAGWTGNESLAKTIATELTHARGRSIVLAGSAQPPAVHRLVAMINESLGNVGTTVSYAAMGDEPGETASIDELVDALAGDAVDLLVVVGGNPSYDHGLDISSARASIHLTVAPNETTHEVDWALPRAHELECWGDGRASDGMISIQQPLIQPLFGGRSTIELIAAITGEGPAAGYDIVRQTFNELTGSAPLASGFDPAWRTAVHDGVVTDTGWPIDNKKVRTSGLAKEVATLASADHTGLEMRFAPSATLFDGRWGNNGWLLETPDPITRLTWDNAVQIGIAFAREHGISTGDVVTVTVGETSVDAAAILVPGQCSQSITLPLGWGRTIVGRVGEGSGFDFYPLRSGSDNVAHGTLSKTQETYELGTVQDHFPIESTGGQGTQERLPTIYREGTLQEYTHHPHFAEHRAHVISRLSLWDADQQFQGAKYKWGMAIDLSTCTGCAACVTACQAENNLPIVGKDQVLRGREMHWIRIDRYFSFQESSPGSWDADQPVSYGIMPVACHHCENAPCEQVCPVAATVHDEEGLNVMVYNRCVGTRYCSNNCPYKVRRFNYFDYFRRDPLRSTGFLQVQPSYYVRQQSGADPLRRMQFNPEVTVRMRGVMEKCTYCTQRIQAAKIAAKNAWVTLGQAEKDAQGRPVIPDGTITPACAQACPTQAIAFGDLFDESSRVARMHAGDRGYALLDELNVKPRTRYMARLTNPIASQGESGDRDTDDHAPKDDHGGDHTSAIDSIMEGVIRG